MKQLDVEEMRSIEGGRCKYDVITGVYYGWYIKDNKWTFGKIYKHKHWIGTKYMYYKTYGFAY